MALTHRGDLALPPCEAGGSGSGHESVPEGRVELSAAGDAELVVDALKVVLHRAGREVEVVGDLRLLNPRAASVATSRSRLVNTASPRSIASAGERAPSHCLDQAVGEAVALRGSAPQAVAAMGAGASSAASAPTRSTPMSANRRAALSRSGPEPETASRGSGRPGPGPARRRCAVRARARRSCWDRGSPSRATSCRSNASATANPASAARWAAARRPSDGRRPLSPGGVRPARPRSTRSSSSSWT